MALGEYFDEEEFRKIGQDDKAPQRYETEDIERAHDEVVSRLEAWARSSWGPPRTYRVRRLQARSYLDLTRLPIIDVVSFNLGGTLVPATDYEIDVNGGQLLWGAWLDGLPDLIADFPMWADVEWTYGHDLAVEDVPWEIKRPCIRAAKALLVPDTQKSKVPANTRSYTTGRTSFDMRFERAQTKPWPWDEGSSSQIRAFWDPFRWRAYIS